MNLKKIKDNEINPTIVISILNQLYAEELQAFYDYFKVAPFLVGVNRPSCQREFEQHAWEEWDHAKQLLDRINTLGGECTITSLGVVDAVSRSVPTNGSLDIDVQCALNRDAEGSAIQHYNEAIAAIGDSDLVTRDLLKRILADEEKHYRELQEFIDDIEEERSHES